LFSGLRISKCLTSDTLSATLSDTLGDTLRFVLQNLVLSRVLFMVRQENEAVIALVSSDTMSDTISFPPLNVAFGCPFLCFINQDHIRLFCGLGASKCLASGTLSATLSDTLGDTLSFVPQNLALSRELFMIRQENEAVIALVSSDTLSDTLSFLFWNLVLSRVLSMFREESSVEFCPRFVKKIKPLAL